MPPMYSAKTGLVRSRRPVTSSPIASGADAMTSSVPSAGSGLAFGERGVPRDRRLLWEVEDGLPALGDLGGERDVLRAERGDDDRDALPDRVVDQLERLAEAGAALVGQRVVLALVVQPVAAPHHPADLDQLPGPPDRGVVPHAVPA